MRWWWLQVYEVSLPPLVRGFVGSISIGISFGFTGVTSVLECLRMRGFVITLTLYMVTPAAVAVLIVLGVALRSCFMRGPNPSVKARALLVLEMSVPLLLRLFFIAYPLVTNIAFDAFSCYEWGDGSAYLKADVAIQCHTPDHERAISLAWVAIILYPFGLLVLNGALLFAARKAILAGKPTALSRSIAFLHQEYEPHLCWWELVEMLRRLVLVGLMVLYQGTMMQIIVGTFIAILFLLLQVHASSGPSLPPYSRSTHAFAPMPSTPLVFLCCCRCKRRRSKRCRMITSRLPCRSRSSSASSYAMFSR